MLAYLTGQCGTTISCKKWLSLSSRPRLQMSTLPKPGHIIRHDFRNTASRSAAPPGQPIKLLQVCCEMNLIGQHQPMIAHIYAPFLQWNIERGYKLPNIIAEMQQIQADVIALQEIDIGCKRSGSVDTGEAGQTCRAPCNGFGASKQSCNAIHGGHSMPRCCSWQVRDDGLQVLKLQRHSSSTMLSSANLRSWSRPRGL